MIPQRLNDVLWKTPSRLFGNSKKYLEDSIMTFSRLKKYPLKKSLEPMKDLIKTFRRLHKYPWKTPPRPTKPVQLSEQHARLTFTEVGFKSSKITYFLFFSLPTQVNLALNRNKQQSTWHKKYEYYKVFSTMSFLQHKGFEPTFKENLQSTPLRL